MLYIAFCRVTKTPYENKSETYVKTHLVEANDWNEARRKIEKHYDDQTDAYSVYYRVDIIDLEETIV